MLGGSKLPAPEGVHEDGGDVLLGTLQKISKPQFWVGRGEPMILGAPSSRARELVQNRESDSL